MWVWKDHSNIDPDTHTHRVWEELIEPPPVKVSHHFPKCIQKRTRSSQDTSVSQCQESGSSAKSSSRSREDGGGWTIGALPWRGGGCWPPWWTLSRNWRQSRPWWACGARSAERLPIHTGTRTRPIYKNNDQINNNIKIIQLKLIFFKLVLKNSNADAVNFRGTKKKKKKREKKIDWWIERK